jgi:hypothetical protein
MKLFLLSDALLKEKVQITSNDDIELLMGHIILNRVVKIAYNNLELDSLSTDFYKAIYALKENYEKQHIKFKDNLYYLSTILKKSKSKYALLKGAFLSTVLFDHGQRTSNDIDILVEGKNVAEIQSLLLEEGFIQGRYNRKENTIIPASRKEIIESRMNFGETIPFFKIINSSPFEVDINFSIDFKPDDDRNLVPELLSNTTVVTIQDEEFNTLNMVDFLIHLCCHLYKEATTYDWVLYRRDLMLYKFSDINVFLHRFGDEAFFPILINHIRKYHVEKECYYTFENSSIIYPNMDYIQGFSQLKDAIKPSNLDFMKQIVYPREKKLFRYNMDFMKWFFYPNRIERLEEIDYETD